MKKIAYTLRLKQKMLDVRLRLFWHRVKYSIYQKPDDAFFFFVMAGLFIVQVMLVIGG